MRRFRLLLLLLLLPLLVLAGLGVAAVFWLRSDSGLAWLKTRIETAASTPGEMELRIGALSGDPFSSLELTDLQLADDQGAWLTLDRAGLDWHPRGLLSRRLEIGGLELGVLSLTRLPAGTAPEDSQPQDLSLPDLPLSFQVETLAVAEIVLAKPLLGQEARLKLTGRLLGREAGELSSFLKLQRLDGDLRLEAAATYFPGQRSLRLDLDLTEGAGGLLAGLVGDPSLPAVALRLEGEAPLQDWQGALSANLEGQVRLDGRLTLQSGEPLQIAYKGTVELPLAAGTPADSLFPGAQDLDLAIALPSSEQLEVERFSLSGPTAAVEVSGRLNLTSLEGAFEGGLTLLDPGVVTALAPEVTLGRFQATFRQSGPITTPSLQLSVEASGLTLSSGATAETVTLDLQSGLLNDAAQRISLAGVVKLDGLGLPDQPQPASLIGTQPILNFEGELDIENLLLDIAELRLEAATLEAVAFGRLPLEGGDADLKLEARMPDIAPLGALAGQALSGAATLTADLRGPLEGGRATGQAELSLSGLSVEDRAEVAHLVGRTLTASTVIDYGADSGLVLSNLDVKGDNLTLTGALSLGRDFDRLGGDYRISVPDLAGLTESLGVPLDGSLKLSGQLSGSLDAPGSRFSAILPGLEASGTLTLPQGASLPQGEVVVTLSDPKPWRRLAGLPGLTGTGEVTVASSGKAENPELQINASFRNLSADPATRAEKVTLQGRISRLLDTPDGTLKADLEGLRLGSAEMKTARLQADGTLEKLGLKLEGDGSLPLTGKQRPLTLAIEAEATGLADAAPQLAAPRLAIHSANITFADRRITLTEPLEVEIADGGRLRISAPAIALDDATLAFTLSQSGKASTLDARFSNLPAELVELVAPGTRLTGRLNGNAKLSGTPLAKGDFELTASDLRSLDEDRISPLQVALQGSLDGKTLSATLAASGFTEAPLTAEGRLPFKLDLATLQATLPEDGEITAQAAWTGALGPIADIFAPANQRIAGTARLDARVTGSLSSPRLDGSLSIEDGLYENLEQGTLVRDLSASLTFDGNRAVLDSLSANDGSSGSLSASGSLDLAPEQGYPLDFSARLERMDLVERDELKATLSGDLALSGSLTNARLAGTLSSDLVEVSIANDLPADVVDLQVIDRNAPPPEERPDQGPILLADVALDLRVDLPRQVFVRGRGLDSEWAGGFDVGGSLSAPSIAGSLDVVRGQITIAGKLFKLTQGTIRLPNRPGAPPILNLIAEHSADQLLVRAKITGPSDNVEVELSSVPPLPQDEILARVLFNKKGSDLSPVEAVQLASAVGDLTGRTSGTDLLDSARRALGVDILRVDGGGEESGPSVEAGTYLSEDVFLGVEQGADPRSGGVSVELEITPNISVESKVKQQGNSNLGVRFEWDY